MSSDTEQRKLAAIMFTDMVGYSALSQRDSKLALELLEEHRQLLREIFPRFHGSEIKTIGDAFLVEFNSALEAAQCAIAIQRALAKRDADAPTERQIQVRIGIHIGDVVHRDGDVYGDGVNIASRIEPLADAGGICVSMDVERQIRNAVETHFEKLAPTELKNISVPMDLFRIVLPWEKQPARATLSQTTPKTRSNRGLIAALLIVAALAAVGGFYLSSQRPGSTAPSSATASAPVVIPEKSIAVLPFENLSRDPDNAYFADGIQDEILARLSKIADLKVISRTSTQKYKSAPDNLHEIAKQLGVSNILEGSVQKAADQVRVTVQLIQAASDSHLWADTYDRKLTDIFGVESEVAKAIAEALQAKLTGGEQQALAVKPTNNAEAYEAYLRGLALESRTTVTPDVSEKAVGLYERAVQLDPAFALAWARLSRAHAQIYFSGLDLTTSRRDATERALNAAQKLQPNSPETLLAQAYYQYWVLRDYELAKMTFGRVRELLPGSSDVPAALALIARRQGRWDESVAYWEQTLVLDPHNTEWLTNAAGTYTMLRQFPAALKTYDRLLDIVPNDVETVASEAAIYQAEGNLEQAGKLLVGVNAQTPSFSAFLTKMNHLQFERHFDDAIRLIHSRLTEYRDLSDIERLFDQFFLVVAQEYAGDIAGSRATAQQMLRPLETLSQKDPDNPNIASALSVIHAVLGQKDAAIKEAERAITLLPSGKDAVEGPRSEENLAFVEVLVGDKNRAIPRLQHLLETPYGNFLTPALLRLDPAWDPLRADPAFQKLCEEKKP
jgi:TolB-like protein/class 3 adenylate cyclase